MLPPSDALLDVNASDAAWQTAQKMVDDAVSLAGASCHCPEAEAEDGNRLDAVVRTVGLLEPATDHKELHAGG